MIEPFDTFIFNSLNNKYAYFAHDDDYIARIYMKNIDEYKMVINYKILKELKGRKKYIVDIPDKILEYLYDLCKIGIAIDFEEAYYTGVTIYVIGDVRYIDDAHYDLDRYRKRVNGGVRLGYDNRKKV